MTDEHKPKGFIENPATDEIIFNRSLIHGVGVNDAPYVTAYKENYRTLCCPYYARWTGMFNRCYNPKYSNRNPTYTNCSVNKEWHKFTNFREWMEQQVWEGMHLDKDLLIPNNKQYSPDTCMFITTQLNQVMTFKQSKNSDLPIGVTPARGRFRARLNMGEGKLKHVGCYDTAEEAGVAYIRAKHDHMVKISKQYNEVISSAIMNYARTLLEEHLK